MSSAVEASPALHRRCSASPLVDALCPQGVNSVDVGDVEQRLISRRVGGQLHQHLVEEDRLEEATSSVKRKGPFWGGGLCAAEGGGTHRLVHAVLQVSLGGEDFVQARRAQRFGHLGGDAKVTAVQQGSGIENEKKPSFTCVSSRKSLKRKP